jgi:hypothetical protein
MESRRNGNNALDGEMKGVAAMELEREKGMCSLAQEVETVRNNMKEENKQM